MSELAKKDFIKSIIKSIKLQRDTLDIKLYIGDYDNIKDTQKVELKNNIIDFKLDFKKDILEDEEIKKIYETKYYTHSYKKYIYLYNISVYLQNTVFQEAVLFKDIRLNDLELKEVTFQKNVGIKDVKIDHLILRPYEIHGNVVVNVDGHAKDGLIVKKSKKDNKKHFINKINFEDPHVCNAKIFFIGTEFNKGDFTNRNLENVVFQNCNFENTYFLNSFLDKTLFLNCTFPIIKNNNNYFFLPDNLNKVIAIFIYMIGTFITLDLWYGTNMYDIQIYDIIILIPTYIITMYVFIALSEGLIYSLYNLIFSGNKKKPLFYHHIGLADEIKLNKKTNNKLEIFNNIFRYNLYVAILYYYFSQNSRNVLHIRNKILDQHKTTLYNLNAIYNDLKINFRNMSNMQNSGDFHYSNKLSHIALSNRVFDTFILMFNYVINGFGERYLRSFIIILITLSFIGYTQNPNEDYISTHATPPFLLNVNLNNENNSSKSMFPIKCDMEKFQKININQYNSYENGSFFNAYDNRFDFNFEEQNIPKLNTKKNEYLVRIYYATSHITSPFTQESKKWFQNMSKNSYSISIPLTIFLWLCLIGMSTAIFNRIRR